MIWIFTVLNGAILHDDQNWSPTYTRIRFLLTELARYEDVWVDSIAYRPSSGPDRPGRLHDNIIKTAVALRSAYRLQKDKPLAFFAYPHSLATFQNRLLFLFCAAYRIPTAVDIHDIREQAAAVGSGSFGVRKGMERYCITRATLLLALNPLMWEHIRQTYHTGVSPVVFISNGVEEEFFTWHPAPYSPVEG